MWISWSTEGGRVCICLRLTFSCGDGKSGVFVCAMALLMQLRKDPQRIDVFGTVLAMSKFRAALIISQVNQVDPQLIFSR